MGAFGLVISQGTHRLRYTREFDLWFLSEISHSHQIIKLQNEASFLGALCEPTDFRSDMLVV